MSMMYDADDYEGGMPMGGRRRGGISLGGVMMGGAGPSFSAKARAGLGNYREAMELIKQQHPGTAPRFVYTQLKDKHGDVAGVLRALKGGPAQGPARGRPAVRARSVSRPRSVSRARSASRSVSRPRSVSRARSVSRPRAKTHRVRLSGAERTKLRKILQGAGVEHGDLCPACNGAGFWDDVWDGVKSAAPVAASLLPLVL